MLVKSAPLFHPKVVQQEMERFEFPGDIHAKHELVKKWVAFLKAGTLDEINEVSLHADFLKDIFEGVLGYPGPVAGGKEWNLYPEKHTAPGGGSADAAIGFFRKGASGRIVAPIELKGARTPLDRIMQGRGISPVQQGFLYANEAGCAWVIVSNYRELRLYNVYKTFACYESFSLADLADFDEFRRFYFLVCRSNFLPRTGASVVDRLISQSDATEEAITNRLYVEYKRIRRDLLEIMRQSNPEVDVSILLSKAQKMLDRILFICFCEDRGLLPAQTIERTYNQSGFGLTKWDNFKFLFRAIDRGDPPHDIPGYNGGLFASDPDLDNLVLPDEAFDLLRQLNRYDFESEVSVNILGHIFEQSIADIEALQAEVRGEELPEQSRRKREGVYYTPPFITQFIVQETLGKYLQELYQSIEDKHQPDKVKGKNKRRNAWIKVLEEYLDKLVKVRVLDPACGSGAFLVAAFDLLWSEYDRIKVALAELRHGQESWAITGVDAGYPALVDLNKTILNNNLYGVDLNEESVEITKLSLWIKTAERGKPLTYLDHNIQCGNSLVDDPDVTPKAFDWKERFPKVFNDGGFDVVIGNPPYIKLQNFRHYHEKEVQWLIDNYESCGTGNFDMYLPFIERGIKLLKAGSRMGYIAPSVWTVNNYGQGLRNFLAKGQHLDRFVDFKSYQVFKDSTTYTALQFFVGESVGEVLYTLAKDGDLMALEWARVPYSKLGKHPWVFMSAEDSRLIECLRENCTSLSDVTELIFVGVQTSMDSVYHLERIGPGRYYSEELKKVVEIEDDIMRPLVKGDEAKRYVKPITNTYILFPYEVKPPKSRSARARLLTRDEMESRFPKAWAYLQANEELLRGRERCRFDLDDEWWQFGRSQNLDKQDFPKLGVAETVPSLRLFCDPEGEYCLHNVRVNGIAVPDDDPVLLWYLLGILNSPVANFVFKRIAKPKANGFYEANKQFIAPLPIPKAGPSQMRQVGRLAMRLIELHTERERVRREVLHRIVEDFEGRPTRKLEQWYELGFAEIHNEIREKFKRTIPVGDRNDWERYLATERDKMTELGVEIERVEREMNDVVFDLYGLTKNDVRLIMADELPNG